MTNDTNISDENYKQLHYNLVQLVIDFFKETGVPENLWSLTFTIDDLESSINYGSWHCCSDSLLQINDFNMNCLVHEM